MTTIFLITGFRPGVTATHDKYKHFIKLLEDKGYKVVPVDIDWAYKTHTQFINLFLKNYKAMKGDRNVLVGNSFGALAVLLSAREFEPDEIYLCSLFHPSYPPNVWGSSASSDQSLCSRSTQFQA